MRLLAAVLALFVLDVHAATVQRFRLNQPIDVVSATFCVDKEPMIALQTLDAQGDPNADALVNIGIQTGRCIAVRNVTIVYTRQVLKIEARDTVFTVYEAIYRGIRVYVAIDNWLHEEGPGA